MSADWTTAVVCKLFGHKYAPQPLSTTCTRCGHVETLQTGHQAGGRLSWTRDTCGCHYWFNDLGVLVGESHCDSHCLDAEEGWLAR